MSLPKIEIITLSYNFSRFVDSYFKAFKEINYPRDLIRINIIDNNSFDDSVKILEEKYIGKFPIETKLYKSKINTGFSGGNNTVLKDRIDKTEAEYFFLLNQDTEIAKDCLNILAKKMQESPDTGMYEAIQDPEHPKIYDQETFETYWCSGGGVLIRKKALKEVGFFDHRFFLYCEDVDLSWRMWIKNWKCKICPEARFLHCTEMRDTHEHKDHSVMLYYSFRNSFFMHYKYNSLLGIIRHYIFTTALIYKNRNNPVEFKAFKKAFLSAQVFIPSMLISRLKISRRNLPKWIYFNNELGYEKRRPFKDLETGERIFLKEEN